MPKRERTMLDGETAPRFYVNSVSVSVSAYDFKLTGGTVESANEHRMVTKAGVIVYMSPQHAKAMSELLAKQVALFEDKYGALPPSPDFEAGED